MAKNIGYLEAIIDFGERHFTFGEDCVGAEVRFSFKGQYFLICFPSFDFKNLDGFGHPKPSLDADRVKLDWLKRQSDDVDFGSERSRRGDRVLSFSCNQLIIRSCGQITRAAARLAKKDMVLWRDVMAKWVEVLGYDDLESSGNRVSQTDTAECYFVTPDKKKALRIKDREDFSASIIVNVKAGIGKKGLKQALRRSVGGEYPPASYMLLNSALKHYNNEMYRQSILDTATAFEMTLIQLLDDKLAALSLRQKKLVIDKYQQINGLATALKGLGVALPQHDIQTKIGTPRNDAMHRGVEITYVEAQEALQFAKAFIYSRLPF